MRLIAVRHGETEWNHAGREMGQLDSPLTERGIRQAEALAGRLARVSFEELYSSDLGRAVETAMRVARACGKTPQLDPGLRERHMGVLQGLTTIEMRERHPSIQEAYERTGHYHEIPGGESAADRRDRSVRVLSAIANRHPRLTVVVVTHGGFLGGFLEDVLGLPVGHLQRVKKDHASFNAFELGPKGWRLETWNDVSHLAGI